MPKLRIYLPDDTQVVHDLSDERITVGRLPDNLLQIEHDSVSSRHCELVLEGGEYHLHDPGSTNGTFVNGEQVSDSILKNGDQVRFGQVEAVYMADAAAGGDQPLPKPAAAPVEVRAGVGGGGRPANFSNSSPFPKPKEKTAPITYVATGIAVLASLAFLAAVAMSLSMKAPI